MADDNPHNRGLTSKIQIPVFDPASTKITARAWIAYVELARDSAGTRVVKVGDDEVTEQVWSDKQTCTNAMLLLQGTANTWGIHILETRGPELSNWAKFKSAFKERFIAVLTLNEKMNLRDLKMSSTDTCRDFYDRCVNNINLFYENEWETIHIDDENPLVPLEAPGTKVTAVHVARTAKYRDYTIDIELKLAFAAGLKESIKRQVLFQESANVKEILAIAQRIESGLKEMRKSEISILNIDSDDEDSVHVNALNFMKRKRPQNGPTKPGGKGKPNGQLKCYYCQKTGHFKSACITMRNDRKKGIFKSNINMKPKVSSNSVDADSDSSESDLLGPSVNNCQTDIRSLDGLAKLLNVHSV